MKRLLTLFLMLAGLAAIAKKPQVILAINRFYAPGKGPYIETCLNVRGSSLKMLKNPANKYQGAIEVLISIKKDSSLVYSDKYKLKGPENNDSLYAANFWDLQRISLPEGDYKFEISIKDINQNLSPFSAQEDISLHFEQKTIFSDIELLESYKPSQVNNKLNKMGYEMIPFVSNYFPSDQNTLRFYTELYNNRQELEGPFILKYFVRNADNNAPVEALTKFSRLEAKPVTPLLTEIPIDILSSGNYELITEARNKNNEVVASQKVFFQRNKSLTANVPDLSDPNFSLDNSFAGKYPKDSLKAFIKCFRPISNEMEKEFIDNDSRVADEKHLKEFVYAFWYKRSPSDPGKAFEHYNTQVWAVNTNYSSSIYKGCETDRGRVYLKYGAPNSISSSVSDANAYPYEIWHYYKLQNQNNKKFVFYNPDLVTNDYQLIHSDAIGEINDQQWQMRIHQRTADPVRDFDQKRVGDSKLDDLIANPH